MTLRQSIRRLFVSTAFAKPVDLAGKKMIVTGSGLGSLGYETAKQLAQWGATVTITTRHNTENIASLLQSELSEEFTDAKIDGHDLDLSNTESVNCFSRWYHENHADRLDCLVNNAGIHLDLMSKWEAPRLTEDGHEIHWRTNYLGTAHLTHNLLPRLRRTGQQFGEARVVNVVSQLHSRGSNRVLFDENRTYESWQAYGLSKLALIHFTNELDRRYAESDSLKSFSLHPGGKSGTYTNVANRGLEGHALVGFLRKVAAPLEKLLMASAEEGAQTQIYCATSDEAESGHYYVNCAIAKASDDTKDAKSAERLWNETNAWLSQCEPRPSPA